MQSADLEVVKDIPGYKVILKAILKSQIQQLVEQLASHTDEESVILTASVSDGTLSHLGSSSGKGFLEDHDDIKSQFLGFCLKRHHRQKQQEKEQEEREAQQKAAAAVSPGRPYRAGLRPVLSSRGGRFRYHPPRQPGYRLPSPGGVRHEPYRVPRPVSNIRQSLSSPDAQNQIGASLAVVAKAAIGNEANRAIKIEPDESEDSRQSLPDSDVQSESKLVNIPTEGVDQSSVSSIPSFPTTPVKPSDNSDGAPVKSDPDKDSNIRPDIPSGSVAADFSDSVTSDGVPVPSGLALDADLSNLISSATSAQIASAADHDTSSADRDVDIGPEVNVKLEAISESDMELEITGVEPGTIDPMASQQDEGWVPGTMGYDSSGATGSQADLAGTDQSYSYYNDMGESPETLDKLRVNQCQLCGKTFMSKTDLARHVRVHTGEKPFKCGYCDKAFSDKSNMRQHVKGVHFKQPVRRTKLTYPNPDDFVENIP